jgi:hypothetical protein
VAAVPGKIGVVMAPADEREQDLEHKNRERKETDRLENLLLN